MKNNEHVTKSDFAAEIEALRQEINELRQQLLATTESAQGIAELLRQTINVIAPSA
jgi:cell division septum initiation protein DivIVA